MVKTVPDERSIYLAFKNVFRGQDAQLRTSKKVRKLIQAHHLDPDVRDLIAQYEVKDIYEAVKHLLEQRVFENTSNAKIKFPEVFDISPTQSANRAASETKAAHVEVNRIRKIVQETTSPTGTSTGEDHLLDKGKDVDSTKSTSSLYPVYLPFPTQHHILVRVQTLLERACYTFGQEHLMDVMTKQKWKFPESVELNTWATTFKAHQGCFNNEAIKRMGKPLTEVLASMTEIRHTAVHRHQVTVASLDRYLSDSELLSQLLGNEECTQHLSRTRQDMSMVVDELKRNKDVLESKLADTLKRITAQRQALDRAEIEAVKDTVRQDREYQELAGSDLEQSILMLDGVNGPAPNHLETAVATDSSVEDEPFSTDLVIANAGYL